MGLLGWTRANVPPMHGRTAVITGGNSGIGYEVARMLLERGASVIIASRDLTLTQHAARDLEEEFPGASVAAMQLDLESLASVKACAEQLLASGRRIHLLINNAGRFLDAPFSATADGFETTMAANFWGHVYLTLLLLPRLLESEPARIINMASPAEQYGALHLEDMKGDKLKTSGMPAYGRSKLMLLMWSQELQRRLRLSGKDVECFVVHPGLVTTAVMNKVSWRYPTSFLVWLQALLIGQTPVQGAQSTIYTATDPSLKGKGGSYIGPSYFTNMHHAALRKPANRAASSADARREVWEHSLQQLEGLVGGRLDVLPAMPTV